MSEQRGRSAGEGGDPPDSGDSAAGGATPRPSGKRASRPSPVPAGSPAAAAHAGRDVATLGRRENPIQAMVRFLREVISELRKVIWPNRKQMVTYTIVVFVFLIFMVSLIFGLDQVFARGVLWLYG
ncbi:MULTISPECIES: preprotein translocase subunit SecE [Hoyosella]|uniref:Protein translocase subunit SecE n=2 Tax=Hoyosella TaxID=697025 RepID=F6EHQ9_HOYSD|nr:MULTISPECIES: preprotein translocase subunit SecE [Hoyosella]AEF38857.1 Preprotein translocase subunit SecE [Hoyosella subflava DQS3-9A1]MBB3037702.1 preprotein translocase subunit SecE [Hoyosella altamirensis]